MRELIARADRVRGPQGPAGACSDDMGNRVGPAAREDLVRIVGLGRDDIDQVQGGHRERIAREGLALLSQPKRVGLTGLIAPGEGVGDPHRESGVHVLLDERGDGGKVFHARGTIRGVVRETGGARDASSGRGAIDEYVRAEVQCRPVVLLLPPSRRDVEVVSPRLDQRERRVEIEKLSAPTQCSRNGRERGWEKDLGRGRRGWRDPWTTGGLAGCLTPSPNSGGNLHPRRRTAEWGLDLGPYGGLTKGSGL